MYKVMARKPSILILCQTSLANVEWNWWIFLVMSKDKVVSRVTQCLIITCSICAYLMLPDL